MRVVVFRGKSFPLGGDFGGTCRGYRYVCTTCGELWGALELAQKGTYQIINWPCEHHGGNNPYNRGGSFTRPLVWWDFAAEGALEKLLGKLSPELLRHEALVLANQLLKH